MRDDSEFVGTLVGYDDYVNMVLEDVVEIERTPEGIKKTHIDEMLLNGATVAMIVPGGDANL